VLNRRGIERTLASMSGQRWGRLGLVMLDVDHFKQINDLLGHPEGDRVLRHLGRVLRNLRPSPLLSGRFGGDEFVIVVHLADGQELQSIVDQITRGVQQRRPDDPAFHVSIGALEADGGRLVGEWPEHLARVDKLLYQAKHAGRNQAVICPAVA
jgi:diguanylate cyclase (GGDEF)-like protein